MFKKRSKLLFITVTLESVLCLWTLFYFNYIDRLSYQESIIYKEVDLALLIENMFTSTWWALIILTLCLITIFSLISFIYKDLKFQFISILLWFMLFILALDIKGNINNIVSTIMLFIPIITINVFSYFNHKSKIK
ncbi:MAG: hypothetical protein PHG03_01690 [Bacilli bacterium]|nr:hypothetical protein [Bacilli bacterium]